MDDYLDSICLLPQTKDTLLHDSKMSMQIIKSYHYFLDTLIDAFVEFYIKKNFHLFDPHVGDTACQIRAYHLITIFLETHDKVDIPNRIASIRRIKEKLFTFINEPLLVKNNTLTISQYMKTMHCDFHIKKYEIFLYECYFLTIYKNVNENVIYINYQAIASFIGITTKLAKKIVRHYQSNLASLSSESLLACAHDLNLNKIIILLKSLSKFDDDNRIALPCYFYNKVLLDHMHHHNRFVLIIVERVNAIKPMVFIYKNKLISLVNFDDYRYSHNDICLAIQGFCSSSYQEKTDHYVERLNSVGFNNIFLMNMANHPQYPGHKLKRFMINPFFECDFSENDLFLEDRQELILRQSRAPILGCARENCSLLNIRHIYCTTIQSVIVSTEDGEFSGNNLN